MANRILIVFYYLGNNFLALHNKPSVMKASRFFALVGLFTISSFSQPTAIARFEQTGSDVIPNYVVIGAFKNQNNAIRFTSHAQKDLKLDAKFEMNVRRNLYYVYVMNTEDLGVAVQEAKRLRTESEFTDTWVYRGSFDGSGDEPVVIIPTVENKPDDIGTPAVTENVATTTEDSTAAEVTPENSVELPVETESSPDDSKDGTKFLFKISRATDLKRIRGDVDVIDVDRSRKMGTYKGNLAVKVSSPQSKSGNMALVCEVFGYRKVQREINYNDPEAGTDIIRDASGSVVIPFELERLRKGDIAVMYNVYFFKDAAVMRPESRYEVNSLLEMLNENPKYKIMIHGHTNGNAAGKIISMNKDTQNFFSLTDTKEGFGSAKELSLQRAMLMRDYMVSNGIDPKRMEIKAWGGKKPIQDKMSQRAQENVRVEIEILQDQ